MNQTPVVDVFAGPGGLAEGFSTFEVNGRRPFRVVLSIEKDVRAHQTLMLRGFYRQFSGDLPAEYWQHLSGHLSRDELFAAHRAEFARAKEECVRHELGPETDLDTRAMVKKALRGHSGAWGLIGGPPCQAYSLIGRSRNRGNADYVPENDLRQTLYVEYLQILADHRPSFFVMENVKGLLSARLDNGALFEKILADLGAPGEALKREGRRVERGAPEYRIYSLSREATGLFGPNPQDVVVRAEEHGIPQARHRVILLGMRRGVPVESMPILPQRPRSSVSSTIKDLPRLRSGVTSTDDSFEQWSAVLVSAGRSGWIKEVDTRTRSRIRDVIDSLRSFRYGRGGEFVRTSTSTVAELGGVINHSTRGHISADLERYLFASCFAKEHGRSPNLSDFPTALLPDHNSAKAALDGGHFADRFKVQVGSKPSSTITSHISKDGHYYIHPDPTQCRSLTVREAARLQTFPDDYLFCGPRTSQYQQVGNAVPPMLAREIAGLVHEVL